MTTEATAHPCDCWESVRCEDCRSDVSVRARFPDGRYLLQRHTEAGHKVTPYGCDKCHPEYPEWGERPFPKLVVLDGGKS